MLEMTSTSHVTKHTYLKVLISKSVIFALEGLMDISVTMDVTK